MKAPATLCSLRLALSINFSAASALDAVPDGAGPRVRVILQVVRHLNLSAILTLVLTSGALLCSPLGCGSETQDTGTGLEPAGPPTGPQGTPSSSVKESEASPNASTEQTESPQPPTGNPPAPSEQPGGGGAEPTSAGAGNLPSPTPVAGANGLGIGGANDGGASGRGGAAAMAPSPVVNAGGMGGASSAAAGAGGAANSRGSGGTQGGAGGAPGAGPDAECLAMVESGNAFLASLDDGQRSSAVFPWTDGQRKRFEFLPPDNAERAGLTLRGLEPAKVDLFMAFLGAVMSAKGKLKVEQIMALETLLGDPPYRDPENYFVSLFGEPNSGNQEPWGLRFEGHHLSLHVSFLACQTYSSTPVFWGTNPNVSPMQAEIDAATALIDSLTDEMKQKAEGKSEENGVTTKTSLIEPYPAAGIGASDMDMVQQDLLWALIDTWLNDMAAPIAEQRRQAIISGGFDAVHFMMADDEYRIQGPTFLIELNYAGSGHIHAAWREFDGDWGEDLLERHMAEHHADAMPAR